MSLKVKRISRNPRFWGPCEPCEVADLVNDVLNDSDTEETLRLFANGEIDGDDMSYRLQLAFEAFDLVRRAPKQPEYEEETA